jgi:YbgC/YbaW family acyl-CoA thioester hydrolase
MAYEFQLTRRIEFSETDMAGIMHFSNFFRFMEAAEHAFFRSLGFSVVLSRSGFEVHLPRVHAECDYLAPVRFEDELLIHLLVEKKGTRSLGYRFRFFRMDGAVRQEIARGRLVVVSTEVNEDGTMKTVSLPKALADKIDQAPAHLFAPFQTKPPLSDGDGSSANPIRENQGKHFSRSSTPSEAEPFKS